MGETVTGHKRCARVVLDLDGLDSMYNLNRPRDIRRFRQLDG